MTAPDPDLSPDVRAAARRGLILAAVLAALVAAPAHAATVRYQASAPGAITITGNTLGLSGSTTGNPSTAHAIGAFTEADLTLQASPNWPLGTTRDWKRNSSDAVLDLPPGARVLYAELVWGGSAHGVDIHGAVVPSQLNTPITFTVPGGATHTVTPTPTTAYTPADNVYYSRSAVVTSLVTAAGTYRVGGVPASLNGNQDAAGWTLFVVYRDFSQPVRNLTVFSMNERVAAGSEATTSVSGLCTPTAPDKLAARLLVTAIEGDAPISGDELRFGPTQASLNQPAARMSGPENPVANFFVSRINTADGTLDTRGTFGAANHDTGSNVAGARQGWDITGVDASARMVPGQNEAWLRGTSTQDVYIMTVAAMQIDLEAPRFVNLDTAITAAPPIAEVGGTVTLAIRLDNRGDEDADDVELRLLDPLPAGVAYVPGSLRVDGALPPGGTVASEAALYTGVALPDVAVDDAIVVTFEVAVLAAPDPALIAVEAAVTFAYLDCNASVVEGEVVAGPLELTLTVCGDGVLEGHEVCDDGNTAALDGCSPGCEVEYAWICDGPPGAAGHCRTVCGDGKVAASVEACDDGNVAPLDGCSPLCEVEVGWTCASRPPGGGSVAFPDSACAGTCGDGVIAVGAETCDDGGTQPADGCSPRCQVERGWTCDGPPGTDAHCRATCGDGVRAVGAEACDDGNLVAGDGCSPGCEIEAGWVCPVLVGAAGTAADPDSRCRAGCGDGVLAVGAEQCDDGNTRDLDGCSSTCEVERGWSCPVVGAPCVATCGDGVIAVGVEACDDGNTVSGDGCTARCEVEPGFDCVRLAAGPVDSGCTSTCGDGRLAVGVEACDDGDTVSGDGCSAECEVEDGWVCDGPTLGASRCGAAACGDGVVAGDEACDDGNTESGDGCSGTCAEVEPGWVCDGTPGALGHCRSVCGDGVIARPVEACDDGNEDDGDGCSECAVEHGWWCEGEPSVCGTTCGDAEIGAPAEACDDGGEDDGDGCSADCEVELGWSCAGEPSVCTPDCGDGRIRGVEGCDDGNLESDDGCSATCTLEGGWRCEGEPTVCVADLDGDGVPDDGDGSGVVGDNPCTGGQTVGCDDNCVAVYNPDQADSDGDGVGDACSERWDGKRVEGGGACAGGPVGAGLVWLLTLGSVLWVARHRRRLRRHPSGMLRG